MASTLCSPIIATIRYALFTNDLRVVQRREIQILLPLAELDVLRNALGLVLQQQFALLRAILEEERVEGLPALRVVVVVLSVGDAKNTHTHLHATFFLLFSSSLYPPDRIGRLHLFLHSRGAGRSLREGHRPPELLHQIAQQCRILLHERHEFSIRQPTVSSYPRLPYETPFRLSDRIMRSAITISWQCRSSFGIAHSPGRGSSFVLITTSCPHFAYCGKFQKRTRSWRDASQP